MPFNSLSFFFFLLVVYILYWKLFYKNAKHQNLFSLFTSYLFYSFWDWRFLTLIFVSTTLDFVIAKQIHKTPIDKHRKYWLYTSIFVNLTLLGFFKYFNFFISSWEHLLTQIGFEQNNSWTLKIILPVGISFYTFQTLSYSFDIYLKRISPSKNFVQFAAFVSFFPQLVAGPIERAADLLPQIASKRTFSYQQCTQGIKLILWGLFKKVVIADSIAPIVDDIFSNYNDYTASTLLLGVSLFSFQIYGDFSGYSDIAIGTAKLFGIELNSNFKFPMFSRNIAEYWQRWHISLSTWFRHYLYIPLGGSKLGKKKAIRNIIIVFLISGFWHGANWTFIIWGAIHAILYIPVFLSGTNRIYINSIVAQNTWLPSLKEIGQMLLTFLLVTVSRIFFRSPNVRDAFGYIQQIYTNFTFESYSHPMGYRMIDYFILLICFVGYEFYIRKDERSPFQFKSKVVRFFAYCLIIFLMLLFYDDQTDRSFIYFQF